MTGRIGVNTNSLRNSANKLKAYQTALDSNAARERYVQKLENVAEQIENKLSPGIYSLADRLTSLANNIDQWNATHE